MQLPTTKGVVAVDEEVDVGGGLAVVVVDTFTHKDCIHAPGNPDSRVHGLPSGYGLPTRQAPCKQSPWMQGRDNGMHDTKSDCGVHCARRMVVVVVVVVVLIVIGVEVLDVGGKVGRRKVVVPVLDAGN
jgi:hypothetical protein